MSEPCVNLQEDGLCRCADKFCEVLDEPACPNYTALGDACESEEYSPGAYHEALREGLMEQYGD